MRGTRVVLRLRWWASQASGGDRSPLTLLSQWVDILGPLAAMAVVGVMMRWARRRAHR